MHDMATSGFDDQLRPWFAWTQLVQGCAQTKPRYPRTFIYRTPRLWWWSTASPPPVPASPKYLSFYFSSKCTARSERSPSSESSITRSVFLRFKTHLRPSEIRVTCYHRNPPSFPIEKTQARTIVGFLTLSFMGSILYDNLHAASLLNMPPSLETNNSENLNLIQYVLSLNMKAFPSLLFGSDLQDNIKVWPPDQRSHTAQVIDVECRVSIINSCKKCSHTRGFDLKKQVTIDPKVYEMRWMDLMLDSSCTIF